MLEVLMVVALAALLTAVTVPAVQSTVDAYRRNAAAQVVIANIRKAQSLAVSRNGVYGFHWGGDPLMSRADSEYRIVRDTTGGCAFPAENDPVDDVDVIETWLRLDQDYPGMRILSVRDKNGGALSGVMFDFMGASVNTCKSVSFPVTVTIGNGTGITRQVEVQRSGTAELL